MEQSRVTQDDVLFGYRLQLFDLAGRTSVSHACRTFGVHRSTYYRWKAQVDRQGLEVLRPREPQPEPHIDVSRPGELVGFDCFYVGRLKGTDGAVWQLTAIDYYSSYAWAELVVCPQDKPSAAQTSKLA